MSVRQKFYLEFFGYHVENIYGWFLYFWIQSMEEDFRDKFIQFYT